jgi:putative cell wall-binding protein
MSELETLATTVDRLAGNDRYATAAAIASTFDAGAPVVRVVTGRAFPDGLVAGAAAGQLNGPVLLTDGQTLTREVRTQLERLAPARIEVVGGTAAVSEAVAIELGRYTSGAVVRRAGLDRYETAAAVGAAASAGSPVFVATGEAPWDALASAPVVAAAGGTLVLVLPGSVPSGVAALLEDIGPGRITVLGGTAAISASTELELARRIVER